MRKENPFTIKPIKEKEEFIGRKDLIDQVADMLSTQQNCHVIGERKSGKTSFLYRMAEEFTERGDTEFVFLDMQQLAPCESKEILGRIAHNVDINLPKREMGYGEFEDFIDGKKVILAFDEISALLKNEKIDSGFFDFLRAISSNFDVVFLTTHREGLYELVEKHTNVSSPFFNYFRNFHLGYFTKEESKELIRKGGEEFLHYYEEWILDRAYYHPFLLQLTCLILFEYYKEKKEDKESIFSSIEEEAYKTLESHFRFWYNKSSEEEQRLLEKISRKEDISTEEERFGNNLERRLLIYRKNNRSHLVSPFFERIIEEKIKKKEKEEKISKKEGKEKELPSLISSLIEKIEKSWPYKIIIIISVILGALAAILTLREIVQ